MEEVFYSQNVKTALKLSHVRGVALLAIAEAGISLGEYSPLEIKTSVVGYGRAEKQQVRMMVHSLLVSRWSLTRLNRKTPATPLRSRSATLPHSYSEQRMRAVLMRAPSSVLAAMLHGSPGLRHHRSPRLEYTKFFKGSVPEYVVDHDRKVRPGDL